MAITIYFTPDSDREIRFSFPPDNIHKIHGYCRKDWDTKSKTLLCEKLNHYKIIFEDNFNMNEICVSSDAFSSTADLEQKLGYLPEQFVELAIQDMLDHEKIKMKVHCGEGSVG